MTPANTVLAPLPPCVVNVGELELQPVPQPLLMTVPDTPVSVPIVELKPFKSKMAPLTDRFIAEFPDKPPVEPAFSVPALTVVVPE